MIHFFRFIRWYVTMDSTQNAWSITMWYTRRSDKLFIVILPVPAFKQAHNKDMLVGAEACRNTKSGFLTYKYLTHLKNPHFVVKCTFGWGWGVNVALPAPRLLNSFQSLIASTLKVLCLKGMAAGHVCHWYEMTVKGCFMIRVRDQSHLRWKTMRFRYVWY